MPYKYTSDPDSEISSTIRRQKICYIVENIGAVIIVTPYARLVIANILKRPISRTHDCLPTSPAFLYSYQSSLLISTSMGSTPIVASFVKPYAIICIVDAQFLRLFHTVGGPARQSNSTFPVTLCLNVSQLRHIIEAERSRNPLPFNTLHGCFHTFLGPLFAFETSFSH